MIHFDLPKEKSSILKVIGVGGGGGNAVNFMHSNSNDGVNFIICNTDAQALEISNVPNKVQLGPLLTQGLGAGANPEIGRKATEESLEEIKKMLEVNTKMAFITAGMGGGTGTGGAPIVAKICQDMGILTVGIVTTPFSYEGKKRQLQAEEGIASLKQHVDTLLVISNDKLRHQYGNLKVHEAFERADNILATAAKCITDVINSTGQINLDFADVNTVMKNGGVAILGSASASGENRAQKAIEDALNSPLLNDNDIRGAKWILININSSSGEHSYTMDEVDTIQTYLVNQAGEGTDVIMGLGYDETLSDKIGITLIATGFEHKDPFRKAMPVQQEKKEEKIIMVLGAPEKKEPQNITVPIVAEDPLAPKLVDDLLDAPLPTVNDLLEYNSPLPVYEPLAMESTIQPVQEKLAIEESKPVMYVVEKQELFPIVDIGSNTHLDSASLIGAVAGGYLAKPDNIYADAPLVNEPISEISLVIKDINDDVVTKEEEEAFTMELVEKEDEPNVPQAITHVELPQAYNEEDEETRRHKERLNKLRSLSFNINNVDAQELENIPAYVRRSQEIFTDSVEKFYSNIEVKKTGDNQQAQISTINTFLDGKKPD